MDQERLKKKPITISTSELVFPGDLNHYGSLFGGKLLSWMDKAAYYASATFCGYPCVTASVESIDFEQSLKSGDVVDLRAKVIYSGNTSMVVQIDVYRMDIFNSQGHDLANTGYFTFVAINEQGKPQRVPQLLLETDEEQKSYVFGKRIKENAIKRRKMPKRPYT